MLQVILLIGFLILFTACPTVGPPQPVDQREASIALTLRGIGGVVRVDEMGRVNEVPKHVSSEGTYDPRNVLARVNAVALRNISPMLVTADVFQSPTSWLNVAAL